ncbi:MAG: hypothetical protein U0547_15110 [Dehalococcoidia bacterium]
MRLWGRATGAAQLAPPRPPLSEVDALIQRGFRDLAGSARGVLYDVPISERPRRRHGSPVYLRETPAWRAFADARRAVDTGELVVLLSLRALDDEERYIAMDWGTRYANCFLLVEPSAPDCDLTDPANAHARAIRAAAQRSLGMVADDDGSDGPGTRATPLGRHLQSLFGTWVYWSAPPPRGRAYEVPLRLAGVNDTIAGRLIHELAERFPQELFDRALEYLNYWEMELMGGPIPRARSVFRTRLGLPVLRDPYCADHAVRRLVNQGRTRISAPPPRRHPIYGPGNPVPEDMSDEDFARYVMI